MRAWLLRAALPPSASRAGAQAGEPSGDSVESEGCGGPLRTLDICAPAAARAERRPAVFDAATATYRRPFECHAVCDARVRAVMWPQSCVVRLLLAQPGSTVIGLLACADQRHALTTANDGCVKCWDTLAGGGGVCTYKRQAGVFAGAPVLSSDDSWLYWCDSGGVVTTWSVRIPHGLPARKEGDNNFVAQVRARARAHVCVGV